MRGREEKLDENYGGKDGTKRKEGEECYNNRNRGNKRKYREGGGRMVRKGDRGESERRGESELKGRI
jgi:hypothetical protein